MIKYEIECKTSDETGHLEHTFKANTAEDVKQFVATYLTAECPFLSVRLLAYNEEAQKLLDELEFIEKMARTGDKP